MHDLLSALDGDRNFTDAACAVLDQDVLANLRDLPGDGNDTLLGELIDLFAKDAPRRMVQLRLALEQGDARRVMQIAHSLKGSSANLGARDMAGICNQLEQRGHHGDLNGGHQLQDELEREYPRVLVALRAERARP